MDIGPRLRREILAADERLIAWLSVTRPAKRLDRFTGKRNLKRRIVCIAMREDILPIFVVAKQQSKSSNSLVKSKEFPLKDLRVIDGRTEGEDRREFSLQFDGTGKANKDAPPSFSLASPASSSMHAVGTPLSASTPTPASTPGTTGLATSSSSGVKTILKFTADAADERNGFAGVLWKICKSYLQVKPTLKNFTRQQISTTSGWDRIGLDDPSTISFLALSKERTSAAAGSGSGSGSGSNPAASSAGVKGSTARKLARLASSGTASSGSQQDGGDDDLFENGEDFGLMDDDFSSSLDPTGLTDDRELTEIEERDIETFLSLHDSAMLDAEAFTERLQNELHGLDSANIHALLSSEMQVDLLMGQFDRALTELDRLDSWVKSYDSVLEKLRLNVEAMQAKHGLVRLQTENYRAILAKTESLVNEVDIEASALSILETGDLNITSDLKKCIVASTRLRRVLGNDGVLSGVETINAVKQKRKQYLAVRQKFFEKLIQFLERVFSQKSFDPVPASMISGLGADAAKLLWHYQQNQAQFLQQVHTVPSASALPVAFVATCQIPLAKNHSHRHSYLIMFSPLIKWLKESESALFDSVVKMYIQYVAKGYQSEGKSHFEQLRHGVQQGAKGTSGKFSFKVHAPTVAGGSLVSAASHQNLSDDAAAMRRSGNSLPQLEDSASSTSSSFASLTISGSASSTTSSTKLKFDQAVEKALALIVPLVLAEQAFLYEFFDFKDISPVQSAASSTPSSQASSAVSTPVPTAASSANLTLPPTAAGSSSGSSSNSSKRLSGNYSSNVQIRVSSEGGEALERGPSFSRSHRRSGSSASANSDDRTTPKSSFDVNDSSSRLNMLLLETLGWLENELSNLLETGNRVEHFNTLIVMVKMDTCLEENTSKSSFLTNLLNRIYSLAHREFDKFIDEQKRYIEETKSIKKKRPGILPFVAKYSDFVSHIQSIAEGWKKQTTLDEVYISIVESIFNGIETIALECKHSDVVRFENYHQLFQQMSLQRISCLEPFRKQAQQEYKRNIDLYVTSILGSPLDKLSKFFEGVRKGIEGGIREEEIGFQVKYSKQELKKIIKEYPAREVKKGLEYVYKKVQKHLCEEASLLQVVWRSVQENFLSQYKTFEGLINRCYPDSQITLEFTFQDLLTFFSDIARSL